MGAPACPHLPGPQLLPQQVHWPGSKNIEKGQLDRHRRITVIITIIITIFIIIIIISIIIIIIIIMTIIIMISSDYTGDGPKA